MRGMVVSSHHLAAQSGLRVLRAGGNAIEAMIAATATISVVYPHMNGLGGDGSARRQGRKNDSQEKRARLHRAGNLNPPFRRGYFLSSIFSGMEDEAAVPGEEVH